MRRLRAIRKLLDQVPAEMSAESDGQYATQGRPSIPPERLFRAPLLQVFYSVRSAAAVSVPLANWSRPFALLARNQFTWPNRPATLLATS